MNVQPEKIENAKPCPQCGWHLTVDEIIEYRDYDDVKFSSPIVRYSCRKCGYRVRIQAPYGVIIDDCKRSYCVKCGMKLEVIALTNYVNEEGNISHVPHFGGVKCFLCGRMGNLSHEFPDKTDPYFFSLLKVHERVKELWQIDYKELLNSKDRAIGEPIINFCFGPENIELILGSQSQNHATLIHAYGMKKFNDYVRGVYFPEKKTIYLREHEKKPWMMETHFILRRLGVLKEVPIIWGPEAEELLALQAFSWEESMDTQLENEQANVPCPRCGWQFMTRNETVDYYNYRGRRGTAPYVRYSCGNCGLTDVDKKGNPAPVSLPSGGTLEKPSGLCNTCGSMFTVYAKNNRSECPKCGKIWIPGGTHYGLPKPEELVIHDRLKELWDIDLNNLLRIRDKATGEGIFKFCFSPETKEFFWGVRPTHHKILIRNMGKRGFGEYARGIVFRERHIIYLRGHREIDLLIATRWLLLQMGLPEDWRIEWGPEAAEELSDLLEGL